MSIFTRTLTMHHQRNLKDITCHSISVIYEFNKLYIRFNTYITLGNSLQYISKPNLHISSQPRTRKVYNVAKWGRSNRGSGEKVEKRDRISHLQNVYRIKEEDYLRCARVWEAVHRSGYGNSISKQISIISRGEQSESGVAIYGREGKSAGRVRYQRLTLLTHNSRANNLPLSLSLNRICGRHSLALVCLVCHSRTPILPLSYKAVTKK